MKIAVGSENPVKIKAVELAFQTVWPKNSWEIVGVNVPSGVADQPMSDGESIKGARNRAHRSLAKTKADYGVGLEAGLQKIGKNWYDCGWIVVVDKRGREGIGSTIRIEVPPRLMKLIKEGMELAEADDHIFKRKNSKQAEGFFGLMTSNAIPRTEGFKDGMIAALARFIQSAVFTDD